ncbi:hypothetical protein D3C71_2017830 [compost metagenome]
MPVRVGAATDTVPPADAYSSVFGAESGIAHCWFWVKVTVRPNSSVALIVWLALLLYQPVVWMSGVAQYCPVVVSKFWVV